MDIYLAALVVFVGRMFTNLTIIRRYYIEKWTLKIQEKKKSMIDSVIQPGETIISKLTEEEIKSLFE